jgi:RimJ/RimL family protein N-acetyltransferase
MNNNEGASIKTPRLYLRRLLMPDSHQFFTYRSDPLVYEYELWRPQSPEEIHLFIERQSDLLPNTPDTWFQMAVCDLLTETMVGDCGLHFLDKDSFQVEVGFTIYPPYQGQGYAVEIVRALLEYLFSTLRKHRVFASVDPRNIRSIRVLERLGLRKEAHFCKSILLEGEWVDDAIYAILEEEWLVLNGDPPKSI